ncbi:hypothetical protein M011DRAFT_171689 [Sporormia fimetaria CBS 119925]|uniref:Uncharacterized protein n=1 Tax=Sporormia fimetaria CBS 119925 TaxID=1340428 RepID=A0A6A6V591_9PLEO|nr:hypothetical protein M011DRAFT_171689 [Sporormia fimetaria CBS 119925]
MFHDDIAAMCAGPSLPRTSLGEAVQAYEKDGVDRMVKLWKQFALNLPSPEREQEIEEPFQTTPPLVWVKAYLSWRVRTGTARLGTRITVSTLQKEFQQLRRCLRLANDFSYPNRDVQVVKKYINNLAKTEGACTATRHKSVAYALDADEIQFYLWNCSERVYAHPRTMVQLSFLLHIISVWGLRTGEMTESSTHRGSNEGIHYGDVCLSLARCQDGVLRYQITIALRNRKFCRGNEGKV